jgi:hypothetical protein
VGVLGGPREGLCADGIPRLLANDVLAACCTVMVLAARSRAPADALGRALVEAGVSDRIANAVSGAYSDGAVDVERSVTSVGECVGDGCSSRGSWV